MNDNFSTRKKGEIFEQEAYEYLKNKFTSVVYMSKNRKAPYDFICNKDNKEYKIEAKSNNFKKPRLKYRQKDADYVIYKGISGKIELINSKEFNKKLTIEKDINTTIMISESTWKQLMSFKEMGQSFDDVIVILMELRK